MEAIQSGRNEKKIQGDLEKGNFHYFFSWFFVK
jgi:hypothetical protein